jgi:hypothetical protein
MAGGWGVAVIGELANDADASGRTLFYNIIPLYMWKK